MQGAHLDGGAEPLEEVHVARPGAVALAQLVGLSGRDYVKDLVEREQRAAELDAHAAKRRGVVVLVARVELERHNARQRAARECLHHLM